MASLTTSNPPRSAPCLLQVVSAIKRLRRRLSVADGLRVVSVRGVGFRLVVRERTAPVTTLPRQLPIQGAAGAGVHGESAVTLPA